MKTDVSGAIGGYYQQIHIAVLELLNLKKETSSVGIECGADIRIFHEDGSKESIEVKFYKGDLGPYSMEIAKTIYNFYQQSYSDIKLRFCTNTERPNLEFFNKLDSKLYSYEIQKEKIKYIAHLLIKFILTKDKQLKEKLMNTIKKKNISCNKTNCNLCNKCISNFIEYFIATDITKLKEFITIDTNIDFTSFATKIQFNFENENKLQFNTNIKKKIINSLKENFKCLTKELDDVILNAIANKIAMEFFDSTVANSLFKNKDVVDYREHKKISKKDVIAYINDYKEYLDEYIEDILELKLIEIEEKANLNEENILSNFNIEFQDFKSLKKHVDILNSSSIKEYFIKIKRKFRPETDLNALINRFIWYGKGFGLIAYLMNLKINEISIQPEQLFIRAEPDEFLRIENKNYYDFQKISMYLKANSRSSNEFFRYLTIEDMSFLEVISQACLTPSIDIFKLEKTHTMDEYQKINNIPSTTIEQLRNLISNQNHILILCSATLNKKPFLNALFSCIPTKQSSYIIAEDFRSLPALFLNSEYNILDSLKSDYLETLNIYSLLTSRHDKTILLIDNYELDANVEYNNIKLILQNSQSLITKRHVDICYLPKNPTFENVCKLLYKQTNLDYSIFDAFIMIGNSYVNHRKKDVITIVYR
ncbi:TPA: hypothetical protein ROX87_004815 [Bacillus thuringiensis]|uniref:hypothetical protein n=1 Tax=Bacillus thuringiensis TaxID=1428 RepID=UPI000BF6808E|nr:hypothetical protein [Bacillus thuringiensis]PER40866.1 hypothetical protein CN472_28940 [Bacillus thuringiensis]HDX9535345.1 hypothetical protein [Bacillus thuringiensis]